MSKLNRASTAIDTKLTQLSDCALHFGKRLHHIHLWRLVPRLLLVSLTILTLSACVTKRDNVSDSAELNRQALEQLASWRVSGKLAIITPDERKSAYMAWQQQDIHTNMTLSTIVGSTIARLKYDGLIASLEADNQQWQSHSPSELVFQVIGWQLPLESMPQWLKGNVEHNLVIERYENGLVKRFRTQCQACFVWDVTFNQYADFSLLSSSSSQAQSADTPEIALPTRITMTQADTQTKLILRIDDWEASLD